MRIASILFVLAVAACAPAEDQKAPAPEQVAAEMPRTREEATAQDTCGRSRFTHLIGMRLDAIDQTTLPPGTRLLTPDAIVTQDFRPDRLNVMSGTDGIVSSLECY